MCSHTIPNQLTNEERRKWLDGFTDVVLGSDAFFPFRDGIDRAAKSGVKYVLQPGGSNRDDEVIAACNEYGMTMVFSGLRSSIINMTVTFSCSHLWQWFQPAGHPRCLCIW